MTEIETKTTGIKAIDMHAHMLFPVYLEGLKRMGIDPVKEDGFPTPAWSGEAHLAMMDEAGIKTAVLSLSTPHIHHGDGALAMELAEKINEESAALCRKYPGRFLYAAVLPLPEVEGSIREIEKNSGNPGAVAVKVPSNANGVYLGDPVLDPVFSKLNEKKAAVLIHPSRPRVVPEHVFTAGPAPLFEYIADTTRAVLNLIANGTLVKYPKIKVVVPHCGSFLPCVAHRMEGISKVLVPRKMMADADVRGSIRKLYFDVAGDALPVSLDALLKIAEPSHILYGSDYPYTPVPMILENKRKLEETGSVRPWLSDLLCGNAEKLLDLL